MSETNDALDRLADASERVADQLGAEVTEIKTPLRVSLYRAIVSANKEGKPLGAEEIFDLVNASHASQQVKRSNLGEQLKRLGLGDTCKAKSESDIQTLLNDSDNDISDIEKQIDDFRSSVLRERGYSLDINTDSYMQKGRHERLDAALVDARALFRQKLTRRIEQEEEYRTDQRGSFSTLIDEYTKRHNDALNISEKLQNRIVGILSDNDKFEKVFVFEEERKRRLLRAEHDAAKLATADLIKAGNKVFEEKLDQVKERQRNADRTFAWAQTKIQKLKELRSALYVRYAGKNKKLREELQRYDRLMVVRMRGKSVKLVGDEAKALIGAKRQLLDEIEARQPRNKKNKKKKNNSSTKKRRK